MPVRTLRQAGQETIVGPGYAIERETLTCAHCCFVYTTRGTDGPGDPGGWCRACMAPVCTRCADLGCDVFEKKLDRYAARQASLRSMGF